MNYLPSPWPNKRAIGASYCIDQAPNGELVCGLTVTLRPRKGAVGSIAVPAGQQERLQGTPLNPRLAQELGQWAEKGVRAAAEELGIDLGALDVELSEFAFHPVDSRSIQYSEAAACAFQSAWGAWCRFRRQDV